MKPVEKFSNWLFPALLVFAGAVVYANSLGGVFLFDDYESILNNASVKSLSPRECMFSPRNVGRPVVGLSFAVNYALSGFKPWSYHAVNALIHIGAALALYGVARRTLRLPRLTARFGAGADALAFFIALIWEVHPLQTQAVTYVSQRAEALMGLFFLLTIYAVIRGSASARPARWYCAAAVLCVLGMGCKPVMLTVVPVLLVYDRAFLTGSFTGALRARLWVYMALLGSAAFAVWSAFLKVELPYGLNSGVGEFSGIKSHHYALTQAGAVVHYFKLAVYPRALCLDYFGWPIAKSVSDVWPELLAVGVLGAATLWGIVKNSGWGFLGAWLFVVLAPTSSIFPIRDVVFEHRMYLPLAALAAAFVLGTYLLVRYLAGPPALRVAGVMCSLAALALGARSIARNKDYATDLGMWLNVLSQFPQSLRANNNVGNAYAALAEKDNNLAAAQRQHEEAARYLKKATELDPRWIVTQINLGIEYYKLNRRNEALEQFRKATQIDPKYPEVNNYTGIALLELGRPEEAATYFRAELQREPSHEKARAGLEMALAAQATRANTARGEFDIADELLRLKQWVEAEEAFRKAADAGGDRDAALKGVLACRAGLENESPALKAAGDLLKARKWQQALDAYNKASEDLGMIRAITEGIAAVRAGNADEKKSADGKQ